ncbi:MAG: radical SAM protein [Candidatus Pacearchaeota archaeon]
MNILLIYSTDEVQSTEKPLRTPEQMHFGISYISSFLKKKGHRTKLCVLSRVFEDKNKEIVDKIMKKFKPNLIGFTSVSTQYPFIAEIAKYIKKSHPEIFLVIGGSHVSINPEKILKEGFDALCIGEGEEPIQELVNQLEKKRFPLKIKNLWIKNKGGKIEKNPTRDFIKNLDSLPFPDREIWEEWTENQKFSRNPVLLGRGCPFQCAYCCNHVFRKLASGTYVRMRSAKSIIKEIKEIRKNNPHEKEIYLEVENFGVDQRWAIELCKEIEKMNKDFDGPLSFGVNLRVTPKTDFTNLFIACKKANFRFINIGLESGSERVRSKILKRHYANEDIINAVKLARKYGLQVALFNLIGLPGETFEDFKETLEVNRKVLPDWHFTSIFFPYPGTDLYKLCEKEGLLKEPLDTKMERAKATLDLPGFSRKQIQKNYIWFDYNVYKGKKPLLGLLVKTMLTKIRSSQNLNYYYRKTASLKLFAKVKDFLKKSSGI